MNSIQLLQQHLAQDLVKLENTDVTSEQQFEKITDVYQKVYNTLSKIDVIEVDNNSK